MNETVFINFYVPAVEHKKRGFLCGLCGPKFRAFLSGGAAWPVKRPAH